MGYVHAEIELINRQMWYTTIQENGEHVARNTGKMVAYKRSQRS